MSTLESPLPRPKLARMAMAASLFAGMVAITGWSPPEAGPADPRAESALQLPDDSVTDTAVERPAPGQLTPNARSRVNCDGCGVIESVRRIDTRNQVMEWCAIGDTADTHIPGNLVDGGGRGDLASLADTAAGVIAGDHRARRFIVTTRHQIVVRFRDGSRHVFNEDSPRTLREGDRIKVIAGLSGVNG